MESKTQMECETPEVGSGTVGYVARFVRYGVTAFGGYLVGKGYIESDTAEMFAAIAATATPVIIGTIIGRMNRRKLKDAVAKVHTNSAE